MCEVPGGADEPGGALICSENFVTYLRQGHDPVVASIPRRKDLASERSTLIVCAATHKQKKMFFFLLQSEYGDLFKATLAYEGQTVTAVHVAYFDTLPGPCTSICVKRSGYLFAAHESGNQ